jgi:hypothetical protein
VGVDISASSWFGVLAPANAKPIIDKLNSAINETLACRRQGRLQRRSGTSRPMTPSNSAAYFAGDFPKFGAAISRRAFSRAIKTNGRIQHPRAILYFAGPGCLDIHRARGRGRAALSRASVSV